MNVESIMLDSLKTALISPAMIMIFLTVITLIIAMITITKLTRSPKLKGAIGEYFVNKALSKLPEDEYTLFKDITLKISEGDTTQIDHIVVSPYGIFIIETKNMKGWIFIKRNPRVWTQSTYGGKYDFQNPVDQNYKHLKTVEKLININEKALISMVVFIKNNEFKKGKPERVFNSIGALLKEIRSHNKKRLLSNDSIKMVCERIELHRMDRGRKTNKEHIRNLNNRHNK
jgi:restriction system protein